MEKLDLRKELKHLYAPSAKKVQVVDVPAFQFAMVQLRQKRPSPAIDRLRLATFHEGLCMQIMHLGPYANEPQTVARMQEFAQANGYERAGKHHEIYLGDPLRSAPEKLKTILRQPICQAEA